MQKFFDKVFPDFPITLNEIKPGKTTLTYNCRKSDLREGNTILGPTMFAIADAGCYAAFMANVGREISMVTTSLSIQFFSRPELQNLVCEVIPDKIGRRLCFARFEIKSESGHKTFAHGVCTYARPESG